MATSVTHDRADGRSWEDLVNKVQGEVMEQVRVQNPELLTNTFFETIKFLSHTVSSRELAEQWLQARNT